MKIGKYTLEKTAAGYEWVMNGACEFGTKDFIKSNNIEHRSYTVREIVDMTKGQYGSTALYFFMNNGKPE